MGDDEAQLHLDAWDGPAVIGIWPAYLSRGLSQPGCYEGLNSISVGLLPNTSFQSLGANIRLLAETHGDWRSKDDYGYSDGNDPNGANFRKP